MADLLLPSLLEYDEGRHTPEIFAEMAYLRFQADVVQGGLTVDGNALHVEDNGRCLAYGTAFWHVATEDQGVLGRVVNPLRCSYVPWIAPLIQAGENGETHVWDSTTRTKRGKVQGRTIAAPDFGYCIVVRWRSDGSPFLLTAYPCVTEWQRQKLARRKGRRT